MISWVKDVDNDDERGSACARFRDIRSQWEREERAESARSEREGRATARHDRWDEGSRRR